MGAEAIKRAVPAVVVTVTILDRVEQELLERHARFAADIFELDANECLVGRRTAFHAFPRKCERELPGFLDLAIDAALPEIFCSVDGTQPDAPPAAHAEIIVDSHG